MSISEIFSISAALVASLGGGALIVFGLSNWLGKVWASRILENETAKHARELEAAKSELLQSVGDRTRKLENLLRHYERQIEEFYGPLFNMVHQVFVANHIQWELLAAQDKSGHPFIAREQAERLRDYYQKDYFYPLHDEIRTIIRTKLYLIDGSQLPDSFYAYLKHAAQERDQRTLWKEHGIDTSFLSGEPWPSDFYNDIRRGFEKSMRNYEDCLEGLKALSISASIR